MCRRPFLLACVAILAAVPVRAQSPPPTPRALIVTGVDHPAHDWMQTTPVVRRLLEEAGFRVDVIEAPAALGAMDLAPYALVVLHFRNEKPLDGEAKVRANLEGYVRRGGGLVLIHFACGAFPDWPEFGRLAGMVWDGVNTHDPRGPFRVRITRPEHPVAAGLADFDTDDELYIGLVERRPVDVFAVARSKVTGRDHPMAFTFAHGDGRVFHTPLGHDVKALSQPGAAELIRRGARWAARLASPSTESER
jgi:type 1 glutamine amidotransferase